MPVGPVAVRVYVVVWLGVTCVEPVAATLPMPLLMLTALAPCTIQVSVELWPALIWFGVASNRTIRADCGVVVLTRAKRSPIKAIALFLRKVAERAGPKTEVLVLLVGRKEADGFANVGDEEAAHWHNFAAIYGLRLGIEKWSDA